MNMYQANLIQQNDSEPVENSKDIILTFELWEDLSKALEYNKDSYAPGSVALKERSRYFALCESLEGGIFNRSSINKFIESLIASQSIPNTHINKYIELIQMIAKYFNRYDLQNFAHLPKRKSKKQRKLKVKEVKPIATRKAKRGRGKLKALLNASPHAENIEAFKAFLSVNRTSVTVTDYLVNFKHVLRVVPNLNIEDIYRYLATLNEKGVKRKRIKKLVDSVRFYGEFTNRQDLKEMVYLNPDGSKSFRISTKRYEIIEDAKYEKAPYDLRKKLKGFKTHYMKESMARANTYIDHIYKLFSELETLAPETVQQYLDSIEEHSREDKELKEIINAYKQFGAYLQIEGADKVGKLKRDVQS